MNYNSILTGPTMATPFKFGAQTNITSTSTAPKDLPMFSLFPAEIREQIWKEAIDNEDGKVIEMKHADFHAKENKSTRIMYTDNKNDHRNLLGACYESRSIIKKTLNPLTLGNNQQVLINPVRDTIYFGPSSYLPNWEILEELDQSRFMLTSILHLTFGNNVGDRLQNGKVRGLHPLMVLNKKEINEGRKQITNIAIDLDLLLHAKRQQVFKQLVDQFPGCKQLTIVAGDMGEKQTKDDFYQKHTSAPQNNDMPGEYNNIEQLLAPVVPGDIILTRQFEQPCLGEVTLQYCPPHVQATVENLVTYYRDRFVLFTLGGVTTQQEEEKGWSVMCAGRGGKYYGHPDRMDWD